MQAIERGNIENKLAVDPATISMTIAPVTTLKRRIGFSF